MGNLIKVQLSLVILAITFVWNITTFRLVWTITSIVGMAVTIQEYKNSRADLKVVEHILDESTRDARRIFAVQQVRTMRNRLFSFSVYGAIGIAALATGPTKTIIDWYSVLWYGGLIGVQLLSTSGALLDRRDRNRLDDVLDIRLRRKHNQRDTDSSEDRRSVTSTLRKQDWNM